jgi:hypothetical protein
VVAILKASLAQEAEITELVLAMAGMIRLTTP